MTDITKLGKYEIRRELGRGAMGVVYEGYDPLIKRRVALKTIRADQLAGENAETVVARFRREAQAAGRLTHPCIVSIYDFGEEEGGVWYIAMEYVDGRELKDYFQANERFTTADIVRIMSQILDALDYSHRQGVIHRDIKPANIILLADGAVKVADFGIAHIETSNMTQVGTTLGTPAYMSPEQIMGLPVDGRSDLFSAGVILYQFLTGERPFSGTSTSTMRKVLEENPLPPSRFNVQAPAAMDGIVKKALAKRPEDRFQTAAEFAAALRAAAQGAGAAAADPTVMAAVDPTVLAPAKETASAGGAAAPAQVALQSPAKQSQSAAMGIVAVAAILAIGAGVWYVAHRATPDAAARAAATPGTTTALVPGPASAPTALVLAETPKPDAAALSISAVGLIDPSDPRYQNDKALLQTDLRADSKSQLVEKALTLLVDRTSFANNYALLKDKLLSKSGSFITTVVQEGAPTTGKDGLVSMTTQAVVNVKALQKSLNQMSRDERVDLIRANGDPKISVRIVARDVETPDAPPLPSPVAENLLKERIKSFGFRTWSEDGARTEADPKGADFAVQGEVTIKKLSMRLQASGITVTKYALASWTVKCIDRATGEEIYHNTTLPKGLGSWSSEGEALQAIGAKIADELSRDLFLQHVTMTGQRITLSVEGMPDTVPEDWMSRELLGLPSVIAATPRAGGGSRTYELQLAGSGSSGDLVAAGVLAPLNAKLGQPCFSLGAIAGEKVSAVFDKRCADASVLNRLETNPPAGLYGAPPARQKTVVKNPETLRKLTV